jgi:hypothetical protein
MLKTYILMALACAAPSFAQQRFDSADAAVQAVIDAAGSHDTAKLSAILGPKASAILTSGNPSQDKAEQSEFAQLAGAKHQVTFDLRDSNRAILLIGDLDWPFPVPLIHANGKWSFDPSQTKVEMDARLVGTHELDAIEICAGYVEAQHKYASQAPDKDGLMTYASSIASGAFPREFQEAVWDAQKRPVKPYHGYYFRMLTAQGTHARGGEHNYLVKDKLVGGFALLAWPAQYGVTGIHTFMVNQDGVIYQKDLGPQSAAESAVKRFDPDPTWSRVD